MMFQSSCHQILYVLKEGRQSLLFAMNIITDLQELNFHFSIRFVNGCLIVYHITSFYY